MKDKVVVGWGQGKQRGERVREGEREYTKTDQAGSTNY